MEYKMKGFNSMDKIKPRLPKGMRDIDSSDMVLRNKVLNIITNIFKKYAFEPIETPALEYWEVLTGKYGADAERLVYNLTDHGGRKLGLRYDLTVPLARYVASHKQLLKPFKRYQIQPVWRAEKPQKGRYREFFQCDIDAVGSESMLVDSELIAIILEIMSEIGFKNFEVRINNRKILQGIVQIAGIPIEQTANVCLTLDKFDKIGWNKVEKELEKKGFSASQINALSFLPSLKGNSEQLLNELEGLFGDSLQGIEGISELKQILTHLQIMTDKYNQVRVFPLLTRGLDYYTGPIYETYLTDIAFSSLGGGGRYNGLVGIFSKDQIPAAGTSFGLDRIVSALKEIDVQNVVSTTTSVLVAQFSEALKNEALTLATECRSAGIHTDFYYEAAKLKKQFSYAHNKGIPLVLLIGPEEIEKNTVQVKDLRSGKQSEVLKNDVISFINNAMKK